MADRESFVDLLGARCEPFVHLSRGQLEALWEHFDLIRRWNRLLNLTRVESVAEAVDRHYAESMFLESLLPPTVGSVVDIGSGAGFPGIPIAITRPDCRVTLVESHKRKAAFLREATGAMANVAVEAERIEALPGSFDVAVSRAVQLVGILPWVSSHAAAFAVLTTPELASPLRTSAARVDLIPIPWHPAHVAAVGLFHVEPAE